jgi:ubiquinone/menaquinone biosynthesis C-methylase UbiE
MTGSSRAGAGGRFVRGWLACLSILVLVQFQFLSQSSARGQDSKPDPPKPAAKAKPKPKAKASRPRREPPGFYMGRRIADVMSYLGADWLLRDTREAEEHPEQMLDSLKIPKGAVVADVGAGVGYTSVRMARRVGPTGTVYATDLQPEMIRMLKANAHEAELDSIIKPILCTPTDPRLPENALDLILMVDVYHECSAPVATLQGLRKALKPGGRLVLVEFRAEDPNVPIKPEHKMTLAQARKEVEPQGFAFKESLEFLPWQHIIIFEKPKDDPAATPKPAPATPPR